MRKETNKKLFLIACLVLVLNNRIGLLSNFPEQKEEEEERDDPIEFLGDYSISITNTGTSATIEIPIIPPFHF